MELHALRLSLTEQDLNDLLRKYLPKDVEVEDLRVKLSTQGIHVTGIYPFFIPVHFETIWEVGVETGHATARLASFKAMGVPGNIFKSAVVKIVEDIAKQKMPDLNAASVENAIKSIRGTARSMGIEIQN